MRYTHENDFDAIINTAAARWGVPAALVKAIIAHESEFQQHATALTGGDGKRGGSYGLMQMSLATARALGFTGTAQDLYDPATNISYGTQYLRDLVREAGAGGYGLDSAISAYNAGNSRWRRGDGPRVGSITRATPQQAMTVPFINQAYVNDVLDLMRYFMAQGMSTAAPAYAAGAQAAAATKPGVVQQLEQGAAQLATEAGQELSSAAHSIATAVAPGSPGSSSAVLFLLAIGAGLLTAALVFGGRGR